MTHSLKTPSNYWDGIWSSIACGGVCLAIAAPMGVLAAFSSVNYWHLEVCSSVVFGLAGTLFLVDAAIAKGRHFRQMRSAVKKILPQGEHIKNEDL